MPQLRRPSHRKCALPGCDKPAHPLDPFCSTTCCREYHHVPPPAPLETVVKSDHIPIDPTVKRKAYRELNRVPCEGGCGKLVEGKGRSNKGGKNRPYLCVQCFRRHYDALARERKAIV